MSDDGHEDSRKGGGEGEGQLARNDPRLTITKPEFQFQELLKLSMGLAQAQDNSSWEPLHLEEGAVGEDGHGGSGLES